MSEPTCQPTSSSSDRAPRAGAPGGWSSSLEDVLRRGEEVPNFPRLAPEIQADLLRALERMEAGDQRAVVARMRPMAVDELIGLALHPLPGEPPPAPRQGTTYTVRPGDSLSKIARRHGLGLRAVIDANPQIANPNLIVPEQVINLPI